ncbi:MAG TPA: LLM class flavin-dependent oxidoreductase, partial [Anaerolineales bacterium]|nr:LLM class flavin-dependent oxidoreductase [Anaerolineales bacterium]
MKFGFITTEGGAYFKEALEEAIYGEELGFDSVWLEEHHSIRNHYWPSPLMALAGIATRTTRVLLGTDIVVLPFYHPVRAAEDMAMLDVISDGRAIFGAAIGYRPPEFELYDISLDDRGARYVEMLKIMRALWTQDHVEYEGKFFKIEGCIEPRPTNPIPIWLGGWGELSLKRAAQLGDAWVPGPTANLEKLLNAQKQYRAFLSAAGKNPADVPNPLTREVVIAETRERALELAEKYVMVNYRDEYGGGWKHPLIGSQDQTAIALESLSQDRFIVGNPDDCIAHIKGFVETFGVDHLICRLYFAGMPHDHIMKELKLLSQEVFPAFR